MSFITDIDVVGVAMQMKKKMYIYTNLNEITFSIFLSTQRFKLLSSDCSSNIYSRVTIRVTQLFVGLPTADFGQNLREKQAKAGDLKPSAQRYFLIS